jgi:hypothetical protein
LHWYTKGDPKTEHWKHSNTGRTGKKPRPFLFDNLMYKTVKLSDRSETGQIVGFSNVLAAILFLIFENPTSSF